MSKSIFVDPSQYGLAGVDPKELEKRKRLFERLGIDTNKTNPPKSEPWACRKKPVIPVGTDSYPPFTPPADAGPVLDGVRWRCPKCSQMWPSFSRAGGPTLTHPLECREDGCAVCTPAYKRVSKETAARSWFFDPNKEIPEIVEGEFLVVYKMNDKPAIGRIVDDGAKAEQVATVIGACRSFKVMPRAEGGYVWAMADNLMEYVKCYDHNGAAVSWKEALATFEWPKDVPIKPRKRDKLYLKLPNTVRCESGLDVVEPPGKEAFERLYDRLKGPRVVTLYHGTYQAYLQDIVEKGLRCGKGGAFGAGIYLGRVPKAVSYAKDGRYNPRDLLSSAYTLMQGKMTPLVDKTPRKARRKKRTLAKREEKYVIEVDVILGESWHAHAPGEIPERFRRRELSPVSSGNVFGVPVSIYDSEPPKKAFHYFAREMARRGCLSIFYDGFKNPEWVVYNPSQVLIKRVLEVSHVLDAG